MSPKRLKIIPLGGLSEIGKNMMLLEYGNDIMVIDAGLMFPTEEMPGIDFVIPDISYLRENQQKLRGIVITHGHEDHIGALPYILPHFDVPVYTASFTQRLIELELKQRGVRSTAKLNGVHSGSKIRIGSFEVEFFPVSHSIPDSMGLIIHTPLGIVVHSGDFKVDYTPVLSWQTDLNRLAQVGTRGVLLLLCDSTYAELPGNTPSERVVGDALNHIVARAPGRVIITTFASLVSRIQQVFDIAVECQRRVCIIGRSMKEITKIAMKEGYLTISSETLCPVEQLKDLPHNQVIILATGSQGEPTSALVRIANREHQQVQSIPGDTVIISATPIPGNEILVNNTINALFQQGANVIYDKLAQVHVHGHGSQEELKLLFNLVKPKFFIPIHGEPRHLSLHAQLAEKLGMPEDNIFTLENGDVFELREENGEVVDKLSLANIYVRGSVVSKLDGSAVLRDRNLLSREGVVVVTVVINAREHKLVGKPQIATRGFISTKGSQALIRKGLDAVSDTLNHDRKCLSERSSAEDKIRKSLAEFFYKETRLHPIIIPTVIEV